MMWYKHTSVPTVLRREIHSISVRENVCVYVCLCAGMGAGVCVRVIEGFEGRAPLASG